MGEVPDVVLVTAVEAPLDGRDLFREEYVGSEAKRFGRSRLASVFRRQSRENLGTGMLAAQLRQHGYEVSVVNASTDGLDHEQTLAAIGRPVPPLIGFSVIYDLQLYNALRIIRTLREEGYEGHITMGGTFATLAYEHLLAAVPGLDSVVLSEGVLTIVDLADTLRSGRDWRQLPGLALRNGRQVVETPRRELADLASLPFAARDSLWAQKRRGEPVTTAAMSSSYGCRAPCTFCSAPTIAAGLGKAGWRSRPASSVVAEMEQLAGELGVSFFYFCDDNFVGYGPEARPRLMEMADRLQQLGLGVEFRAEIRADSCRDLKFLETLRSAGLTEVLLGVESGSPTALKRHAKGSRVETNAMALENTRALGFSVEPSMILVDAYTTVTEFCETVDFIERLKVYDCKYPLHIFNRLLVFPGTPVEKIMEADGRLTVPDPWQVPEDLSQDEGLFRFCQRVCHRAYTIEDPVIRSAWTELAPVSNRVSALAAHGIRELVENERPRLDRDADENDKSRATDRYLELLRNVRDWRAGLGNLTMSLLRTAAEWCVDAQRGALPPDGSQLGERLAAEVDDHNRLLGEIPESPTPGTPREDDSNRPVSEYAAV